MKVTHQKNGQLKRSAFTLIEVLITSVLTSVLMLGMWGVMGTYLSLFNRGEEVAKLSQLVRGLTQQLQTDIEGVIATSSYMEKSKPPSRNQVSQQKSGAPTNTSGSQSGSDAASSSDSSDTDLTDSISRSRFEKSSSVVQFGIVGSSRNLRLDLIQLVPIKKNNLEEDEVELSSLEEEKQYQPKVPEIRTVIYSFEKGREWSPQDNEPKPGFIRQEMSWEEYLILQSFSSDTPGQENDTLKDETTEYDEKWPTNDKNIIWVPEIYNLKFRYFNGDIWLGSWNSYSTKILPVAIEIVYVMESNSDRKLRKKNYIADENDEENDSSQNGLDDIEPVDDIVQDDSDSLSGNKTEAERVEAGGRQLFRQVIYLPMGKHKKESSKRSQNKLKDFPESSESL